MLKILSRYVSFKTLLLLVTEVFWITGAMIVLANLYARYVRHWEPGVVDIPRIALRVATITLICQVCLYYNDLYDLAVVNSRQEVLIRILQSMGAACLVLFLLFLIFPKLVIGSSNMVATGVGVGVLLLLAWRMLFTFAYRYYDQPSRVVILGGGELAHDLVRAIRERSDLNMLVMGLVGAEAGEELNPAVEAQGLRMLGTIADLETVARDLGVNRVVVALADRRNKLPVRALLNLKLHGVVIDDAWSLYEKVAGKIRTTELPPGWLVFGEGFNKLSRKVRHKETLDFILALIAGLIALPVAAIVALIVKLDSKGPILFRQERVGYKGALFEIIKFRTMRTDAEELSGPQWSTEDDPRITRAGRFLRKVRLDEIPQIWNVLRGEMSLVGPRAERQHFVDILSQQLTYYAERHMVRPGITGWAQIRYRYGASVEDARQKLQYDLFYIKNLTLMLDLAIMFETVKIVLFGRGR
jgi:sugar transferase (PEP-CTERM system associated)